MSTVFIVGNGFDLDLGLRTKYEQFFKSKYFKDNVTLRDVELIELILDPTNENPIPFQSTPFSVFDYLAACQNLNNWCDIERALGNLPKFIDGNGHLNFSISKDSFEQLHIAFADYLKSVIDEDYQSMQYTHSSFKLAKALSYVPDLIVFNYNYTDSLERIDPVYKGNVNYVHGSLNDNSIIFGVEDKLKVPKSHNFLLKSFSPHYKSHRVRYELKYASHIIFFGHSLAKADYHYFEGLFQELTSDNYNSKERRKITIFTGDDASRREILWQIRKMNHNKTDLLFGNCDLTIFTKDSKQQDVIAFLMDIIPGNYDPSFLYE